MKKITKGISVVLSILLIFSALEASNPVIAADLVASQEIEETANKLTQNINEQLGLLYEIQDRGRFCVLFSKH